MIFAKDFLKKFNKLDYDFDRPDISLYNFHRQFLVTLALNGIFYKNRKSLFRLILPTLFIMILVSATGMEILFVFHGVLVEDFAFATECFFYVMVLGGSLLAYSCTLLNTNGIYGLLENMNGHFVQVSRLGKKYRDTFLKGQLLIWQCFVIWIGFLLIIAFAFISNTYVALFYQSLFAQQDEHQVRPLIFPMWLPEDDPYRTPNYEVFMFFNMLIIFIVVKSFGVYIYATLHYLIHYHTIMELIIFDLEALFVDIDESTAQLPRDHEMRIRLQHLLNSRIQRITTWHSDCFKAVDMLSIVYGPTLVYQTLFSSLVICAMTFLVADQLEHGKLNVLFCLLTAGACAQLFIPCYLGTKIRDKGYEIGDAGFNSGFHMSPAGPLVRDDLLFIIMRSQRELGFKFVCLPCLTLETYSSVMSTAYSYFNMLRQSTK